MAHRLLIPTGLDGLFDEDFDMTLRMQVLNSATRSRRESKCLDHVQIQICKHALPSNLGLDNLLIVGFT